MENKTQSRKWTMVINNPLEAGFDHTAITETLHLFCPSYFCMADEIATTGTFHTHIFLCAPSPIRFSTLHEVFRNILCVRNQKLANGSRRIRCSTQRSNRSGN